MSLPAKNGIYLSPDTIVKNSGLVHALKNRANTDFFVIRAGFSPENENPLLADAVNIVREEGGHVCILAGTWWGEKESSIPPTRYKSNEARYPMVMPGGDYDPMIHRYLERLCRTLKPDSICLTHARYRHPAFLEALIDDGADVSYQKLLQKSGIDLELLKKQWNLFLKGISDKAQETFWSSGNANNLERVFKGITGSNLFSQYIDFRCRTIEDAAISFKNTVKNCSEEILFGSNIYSPVCSRLCGQDYHALSDIYDFLQPLLGYLEWHVLEPIAALAQCLHQGSGISQEQAVLTAKSLFSFDELPDCTLIGHLVRRGEGTSDQIVYTVSRELSLLKQFPFKRKCMPVLRGNDWDRTVTGKLSDICVTSELEPIVFQGEGYLSLQAGFSVEEKGGETDWQH